MRQLLRSSILVVLGSNNLVHAANIEGRVIVRNARDNANAVIYIEKISGQQFKAPLEPIILDQVNLTFVPHVVPVLVGTKVAFPNSDEIRHNVFSPAPTKFDLGTYPRKTTRFHLFDKPGVVTLLCNVHAEMSAYVVVVETPYFSTSARDGSFTIKDVPPGRYILKFWHEKMPKGALMEIEVTENAVLQLPPMELKK